MISENIWTIFKGLLRYKVGSQALLTTSGGMLAIFKGPTASDSLYHLVHNGRGKVVLSLVMKLILKWSGGRIPRHMLVHTSV